MTCRWILLLWIASLLVTVPASAANAESIVPSIPLLCSPNPHVSESLHQKRTLQRFYRDRNCQLVWSDGQELSPLAEEFLLALPDVVDHGLNPRTYHLSALQERSGHFRAAPTAELAAELDLLLSDAFISLANDGLRGRISPADVDREWLIPREKADPLRMLRQALNSGRIRDSLFALFPQDPAYEVLRQAWLRYRDLAAAGGWSHLQIKTPLRPGATGVEISALRRRLALTGDLVHTEVESEIFDDGLMAAVQHFQERHGLTVDGIVGPATLAALNVPAAQRLQQLALNMERWRWLPRQLGERHLRINLPAFYLKVVENRDPSLMMRVIIGRLQRQTPAFVGHMTYLVLNPYWQVPRRLAVEDLLPKFQKDAGLVVKDEYDVLNAREELVDPTTINWHNLNAANFPYHLRQRSGPKNALGQVKFIFPNPYDIYLHDTPSRKLFDRDQRYFSSGCIRIEKPYELVQWLLPKSRLATEAGLQEALKGGENTIVTLPEPIPVYIFYLTAWVEDDATVNFRTDLYLRDQKLANALRKAML